MSTETPPTLSDIRSPSCMRRARNEFGSRDSVVLVVRKQVPPTFKRTHWLLPCRTSKLGLFRGFKLTVDIVLSACVCLDCAQQRYFCIDTQKIDLQRPYQLRLKCIGIFRFPNQMNQYEYFDGIQIRTNWLKQNVGYIEIVCLYLWSLTHTIWPEHLAMFSAFFRLPISGRSKCLILCTHTNIQIHTHTFIQFVLDVCHMHSNAMVDERQELDVFLAWLCTICLKKWAVTQMLLRNKHWLGIIIPVIIDRLQWCASQASLSVNWLVSVAGQPIYHAWKHGQVNRKDLLTERTHSSEQSNRILIAFASVNTRKWCMCIRACVVSNTWAYHHQKNIRHKCHSDLSCRLTLTALSCGRRLLLVCSTFEY